jgi:hypothetical protein
VNEGEHKLQIRDRFSIDVLGRQYSDGTHVYDRNWLIVSLSAKDDISHVTVRGPCLLTFELRGLLLGTTDLLTGKASEFTMSNLEGVLKLSFHKRDDLGHFSARIVLRNVIIPSGDPDFSDSIHEYEFGIDQTDLQIVARQLDAILEAYPVLGQP